MTGLHPQPARTSTAHRVLLSLPHAYPFLRLPAGGLRHGVGRPPLDERPRGREDGRGGSHRSRHRLRAGAAAQDAGAGERHLLHLVTADRLLTTLCMSITEIVARGHRSLMGKNV